MQGCIHRPTNNIEYIYSDRFQSCTVNDLVFITLTKRNTEWIRFRYGINFFLKVEIEDQQNFTLSQITKNLSEQLLWGQNVELIYLHRYVLNDSYFSPPSLLK